MNDRRLIWEQLTVAQAIQQMENGTLDPAKAVLMFPGNQAIQDAAVNLLPKPPKPAPMPPPIPSPLEGKARENLPLGRPANDKEKLEQAIEKWDPKSWASWLDTFPLMYKPNPTTAFKPDMDANPNDKAKAWDDWVSKNMWIIPHKDYWAYPGNERYRKSSPTIDKNGKRLKVPGVDPKNPFPPQFQPYFYYDVLKDSFDKEWDKLHPPTIPPLPGIPPPKK